MMATRYVQDVSEQTNRVIESSRKHFIEKEILHNLRKYTKLSMSEQFWALCLQSLINLIVFGLGIIYHTNGFRNTSSYENN